MVVYRSFIISGMVAFSRLKLKAFFGSSYLIGFGWFGVCWRLLLFFYKVVFLQKIAIKFCRIKNSRIFAPTIQKTSSFWVSDGLNLSVGQEFSFLKRVRLPRATNYNNRLKDGKSQIIRKRIRQTEKKKLHNRYYAKTIVMP